MTSTDTAALHGRPAGRPIARRTTWRAVVLAVLAATLLPAVMPGPAVCAPAAAAPADGGVAFLRGAHLSPDTGAVDVYLTAFSGGTTTLWLSKVGYGDVSPYRRIAAGTYAVSMRPHGAAMASAPVLSWSVELTAGRAYTAFAIGMAASLRGTVVADTLTAPPAGSGLVRVVQASDRAGRVNVDVRGGPALADGVAFGSVTPYARTAAGTWTVELTSASNGAPLGGAPITVRSGSITSVVVLDDRTGRGVIVRPLLDAAGAGTPPSGAVPAGGGGAATSARPAPGLPSAGFAVGGAALLVILLAVMRGRRRRPPQHATR